MPSKAGLLLLLLLSPLSARALVCDTYGNIDIPDRVCGGCDNELFINDDCSKGFLCTSDIPEPANFEGCSKECPTGQILVPLFENDEASWECRQDDPTVAMCRGPYHVRCPADALVDPITKDSCDCDHQLLISDDCSSAFFCEEKRKPEGGISMQCGVGKVMTFDLRNWNWGCEDDVGQCPTMMGGITMGCKAAPIEVPDICTDYALENPYGTCECDGQLFINQDCTTGFFCTSNIPDDELAAGKVGCTRTCPAGQILLPDFVDNSWMCVDTTDNRATCNGQYHLQCPGDNEVQVDSSFDPNTCSCDHELLVTSDCKRAYFCDKSSANGGYFMECTDANKIITFDIGNWNWGCTDDVGQCPGLGGFKIGCEPGNPQAPLVCSEYGNNDLGSCEGCDGQLFINEDCSRGFVCTSNLPTNEADKEGCSRTCPPGQILLPNFIDNNWQCVDEDPSTYTCPGSYHLRCPSNGLAAPFSAELCECENELFVSADCRSAMMCNKNQAAGAFFRNCPEGQVVSLFLDSWNWGCSADIGQCPGLGGFTIGCEEGNPEPPLLCDAYGDNDLGTCDCENQVFINEDCTKGFICSSDIPDPTSAQGCSKECPSGFILVPNFEGGFWQCLPDDPSSTSCPGAFSINCPDNDIGNNFSDADCTCGGELLVSKDCKEAYKCRKDSPGVGIKCGEGKVIELNIRTWNWGCTEGEEKCPGQGGFKLGCGEGAPTEPEQKTCDSYGNNPLGTCDGCEDQFFISEDCTEGFLCTSDIPESNRFEGCYKQCPRGYHLLPDFVNGYWSCVEDDETISTCPGSFKLECDALPTPLNSDLCTCDHELIVNADCKEAFFCEKRHEDGGYYRKCGNLEIITIDIRNWNWGCQPDEGQCPGLGGFALGCEKDEIIDVPLVCDEYANNPIGVCEGCNNQVFINKDCTTGFICTTDIPDEQSGKEGCVKTCPTGQHLLPDFANGGFTCEPDDADTTCPGEFHTRCPSNPLPYNLDKSDCDCNQELLVSPNCKAAFYCSKNQGDEGGFALKCDDEGDIIQLNLRSWNWGCQQDTTPSKCPGAGGFTIGCSQDGPPVDVPLICDSYGLNEIATCGCEDQVFISEDCSSGFVCTSNLPDPDGMDGCAKECPAGQILIPNFGEGFWECVEDDPFVSRCPGELDMRCPANDLGSDFTKADCECEAQFLVSSDCTEAFLCRGAGQSLKCGAGQIVQFDVRTQNWGCKDDDGTCPGQGGFTLGCGTVDPNDTTTPGGSTPTTTPGGGGGGAAAAVVVLPMMLLLASVFTVLL